MLHCLLPEHIVQYYSIPQVFSKVWTVYYKATTLHRPESRALEIEILSRGFSSLLHPPFTREAIGGEAKVDSRVWHDFLAAISTGGEFESSTGPTDGAELGLFLLLMNHSLFNAILLDVQYLSIGVTQKRLKLDRLTLQKVGYIGLSVEWLEMT